MRGLRADEAREAVRTFVDEAALAGLAEVRSCTAAAPARSAPRCATSSTAHPLVDRRASEAQDGATVAYLTS